LFLFLLRLWQVGFQHTLKIILIRQPQPQQLGAIELPEITQPYGLAKLLSLEVGNLIAIKD
jgi:hypothetical protein